jgi:uncharacterized protein (DUF1330 family)
VAAYVIVETDITNAAEYERCKAASPAAIDAGGGRFLARAVSWRSWKVTGDRPRLVVLEFEDLAAARNWYQSEIYQQAKQLRDGAGRLRMVAVQGIG